MTEWSISIAYDVAVLAEERIDAIIDTVLTTLQADTTVLGPAFGPAAFDQPMVGATANAVAPGEATALRQVDAALRRAFQAAGLEVGAIRRAELVRYDVQAAELRPIMTALFPDYVEDDA